jgi:hypothetical protein
MGFGDYSTMGRDALRLLDEQVVGFLIGFVEDVGVNLGRYSRVGVLGITPEVYSYETSAATRAARFASVDPSMARRIFVSNAFTFSQAPLSLCTLSGDRVFVAHYEDGAVGVADHRI